MQLHRKAIPRSARLVIFVAALCMQLAVHSPAYDQSLIDPFAAQSLPKLAEPVVEPVEDNDTREPWYFRSKVFGQSKEFGVVYLSLMVLENGTVSSTAVEISSGSKLLDHAAEEYAKQTRFSAGSVNGKRVAMPYVMKLTYCPFGKDVACEKKQDARASAVDHLLARYEDEIDQLRESAIEAQQRELRGRRQRSAQEQPYRVAPTTPLTHAEMAVRVYQAFYHFTYCGDSQYQPIGGTVVERKGQRFHVQRITLDELDRLNGYEWKGRVEFSFKIGRNYDEDWSDWYEGYRSTAIVWRKNGQWYLDEVTLLLDGWIPDDDLTCSDIPQ